MRHSKSYIILFLLTWVFSTSNNAFSQVFKALDIPFSDALGLIMERDIGTNGISVADYNNDGSLDLYFVVRDSAWGGDQRTWNRLFSFQDGKYIDETSTSKLTGISETLWSEMGFNIGASWGDYNNDGYPDIFLNYTGNDQLFRNNGNGIFTDVSSEAGISGGETQLSSHGIWWDFDKDGDLDLYVTVRKDVALVDKDSENRMYENIGNDQFLDISTESGLNDDGLSYSAIALDVNNDSYLDIYVANDFGKNSLFLNNGDKSFTKDTSNTFGLNDIGEGMGLAISDVDNNGFFDIYVTNVTSNGQVAGQTNPLFLNSGSNSFQNLSDSANTKLAGWGWGTQFFDFDNDSDDDLFISNGYFSDDYHNYLYENISTKNSLSFINQADSLGLADLAVSRANVAFDQNDDGFVDILISNFYDQPILYRNTLTDGNWIKINLEGTITNRNAFGSIIELETDTAVFRKYHHGAHFFGQNILPIHLGLANAEVINRISIYWLNGTVEHFQNIEVNQSITIRETEGIITSSYREHPSSELAKNEIRLQGNYPNPFNAGTQIQFSLQRPGLIQLTLFDVIGRKVFHQSQFFSGSGSHQISWNPDHLNTGVYFYQLSTGSHTSEVGKMLLVK